MLFEIPTSLFSVIGLHAMNEKHCHKNITVIKSAQNEDPVSLALLFLIFTENPTDL